jgi:hypothetical protein
MPSSNRDSDSVARYLINSKNIKRALFYGLTTTQKRAELHR